MAPRYSPCGIIRPLQTRSLLRSPRKACRSAPGWATAPPRAAAAASASPSALRPSTSSARACKALRAHARSESARGCRRGGCSDHVGQHYHVHRFLHREIRRIFRGSDITQAGFTRSSRLSIRILYPISHQSRLCWSTWLTDTDHARRQILGHSATRTNDYAVSDRNSGTYPTIARYPDLLPDADWTRANRKSGIRIVVIGGAEIGVLRDDGMGAYCDGAQAI